MKMRADSMIIGIGVLLHVAALAIWSVNSPHSPKHSTQVFMQQVAVTPHHPHRMKAQAETTGKIGYLDPTNKVAILELESGAIVQALVTKGGPPYRIGQRVRISHSLGHHGQRLYSVKAPLHWHELFGRGETHW